MPCDSVVSQSVVLDLQDRKLLDAALVIMGATDAQTWGSRVQWARNGSLYWFADGRVQSRTGDVNAEGAELRRAYSVAVVRQAARRAGWAVKTVSARKLEVMR